MSGKIVVIGSSNVDLIMKVEHLPKPGETVSGGVFHQTYGGKGANQAVAAARSCAQVSFISCLGKDGFSSAFIKNLEKDGINTKYIQLAPKMATGTALIMIDNKGENCISVAPGANYALNPQHIDQAEAVLHTADLILLQCELHPDTLQYIIEKGAAMQKKIVLNLAPAMPLADKYLKLLNILIVNESEAAFLSKSPVRNLSEAQNVLGILAKKTGGGVILTLGAKGSLLSFGAIKELVPAYPVKAVDTTAAGDVYCGTLATALVGGKPLLEAVRFASAAAAIAVTRLGAQDSAPKLKEIEAKMRNG